MCTAIILYTFVRTCAQSNSFQECNALFSWKCVIPIIAHIRIFDSKCWCTLFLHSILRRMEIVQITGYWNKKTNPLRRRRILMSRPAGLVLPRTKPVITRAVHKTEVFNKLEWSLDSRRRGDGKLSWPVHPRGCSAKAICWRWNKFSRPKCLRSHYLSCDTEEPIKRPSNHKRKALVFWLSLSVVWSSYMLVEITAEVPPISKPANAIPIFAFWSPTLQWNLTGH